MYQKFIRPILFLLPPERIHRIVAAILPALFFIPGMGWLFRKYFQVNDPALEREVFGIRFPNPVGIAAGFDKEAGLYNALANFGFGHVEIGTVTPLGQKGNPRPRLFRLPEDEALINRMGFNNHGVEAFVKRIKKNRPRVIIGGNIGKNTQTPNEKTVDDYCYAFDQLHHLVNYFVVNVSCPNIKGLNKLQDKGELLKLLHAIQEINNDKLTPRPVLLKIAPDLSNQQLDEIIEIVRETKLDGIVATNTSTGRENLKTNNDTIEAIGQGGLSGKPIRDKSTKTIRYLHEQSGGSIPIVGVGGIADAEDALEKLKAGATLVQVYTGFVYTGPSIAKKINRAITLK